MTRVTHIVARDVPAGRLRTLFAVRDARDSRTRHAVVRFGPGAPRLPGARTASTPLGLGGAAALATALGTTRPEVVHCWSASAAKALLATRPATPVIVDVDLDAPLGVLALLARDFDPSQAACVAPTRFALQHALRAGFDESRGVVVRDGVDYAVLREAPAARSEIRAALELPPEASVVLVLADRPDDMRRAVWGVLLANQVDPRLLCVVPGGGAAVERARYLSKAVRLDAVARFAGGRFPGEALAASADMALHVAAAPASVHALPAVLAAGVPVVATANYATAELLADGENAWLCRSAAPRELALRMLRALDDPARSRRQAELARAQAFKVFSSARMLTQYDRVYANLARGDAPAAGVEDAAAQLA